MLTNAQLRLALRTTGALAELDDLDDYAQRTIELLGELIPCDMTSYNVVDPSCASASVVADPADAVFAGGLELFAHFAHQNPLVSHYAHTGDGSALRISDFLTRRELHDTDLYDLVYRHLRLEYQLAITVPSPRRELGMPGELIGLTLSRADRDFSEGERLLLELVRPHFAAALRRAHELALARAIGSGAQADRSRWLLLATHDGTVAWANAAAAEGLGVAAGERLPAAVIEWWAPERARHEREPSPQPAIRHEGRRLRAQLVRDAYPQLDAICLTPAVGLPGPETLRGLGLTARQAEVLALALEGCTSAQLAHALGLSRRTVEKHLEAIYTRLGVENRAQAISSALRAV